jgi:hypothetical protein
MKNVFNYSGVLGLALGLAMSAGTACLADEGRLVIASGAPGERQMLVLNPLRPGESKKLGQGEAFLADGAAGGLVSDANKLEQVVLGDGKRAEFAKSAKLVNAGQAVKTEDGRLFVISQGNKRIIEFGAQSGKFVSEHFLEGPSGEAMSPRGLAVIDKGLVALGTDSDEKNAVRVFVLEAGGDNTQWHQVDVTWPEGKAATRAGQACRVSETEVAFVDGLTLRVIELDFSQKKGVKGKTVATLNYGQAAGASGLALDGSRGVYYVGSVGKDTVLAIKRSTGEGEEKIAPISVTDPTFLSFVGGAVGSAKAEPAKKGKDPAEAPKGGPKK